MLKFLSQKFTGKRRGLIPNLNFNNGFYGGYLTSNVINRENELYDKKKECPSFLKYGNKTYYSKCSPLKKEDYKLAVATAKWRDCFERDLTQFKLNNFFDITRCSDEGPSKPDPALVREIINCLNISPKDVIFVGDTQYDMSMANQSNISSIAVTYTQCRLIF